MVPLRRRCRTAEILVLSRWAIGIALALFVAAMFLYPGGTVNDASTSGYNFFRNFGSDLGRTVAFNGQSNRLSQILSTVGGFLLMLGIVASCSGVAAVYSTSPASRGWALLAVMAGLLATSMVLAAFLIPADRNLAVHVRLAYLGFDIAPVVPLCFALATVRNRRLPLAVPAGWTLMTLVLAGFVVLRVPITTDTGLIIQVTAQKIVFIMIAATLLYEGDQAKAQAAAGDDRRSSSGPR